MNNPFSKLKPERLWHYFREICTIPRPSRHEEHIVKYLLKFAQRQNLEYHLDESGNVLIRKPASTGFEHHTGVILQSHLDMVGEKNAGKAHDFTKDPIVPRVEGDWIKAQETTLGADDGIGIAAQLAILESKDILHGPLECLFTVDEETGLTGAFGLKTGFLQGKILLNLDSEDEGQIFIGCAGGKDTIASLDLVSEPTPEQMMAYKISLTGLKGGHSGDDINKGLGNAVKLLNRILWNGAADLGLRISGIDAGNLRNAIPREGFAEITVPTDRTGDFEKLVHDYQTIFWEELHITEPDITLTSERIPLPPTVLLRPLQEKILNALYGCPHGVIAMSREIPGFVETSTNLASVKFDNKKVIITTSQRSSVESSKKDVADMVAALFRLAGAKVEQSSGYPGWKPDPDSEILKIAVDAYHRLFQEEPQVLAIHAGLECGLIGAIYPGMDMISFGPTIKGAHSPDERLYTPSVMKFWELTLEILRKIK